jgi:hypothetical protein
VITDEWDRYTCIAAGLVGGEGFAVDASLIGADANKHLATSMGRIDQIKSMT